MARSYQGEEFPVTIDARKALDEAKSISDAAEVEARESWNRAKNSNHPEDAQEKISYLLIARSQESSARSEWEKCRSEEFLELAATISVPISDWEELNKIVTEANIDLYDGRAWIEEQAIRDFQHEFLRIKKFNRKRKKGQEWLDEKLKDSRFAAEVESIQGAKVARKKAEFGRRVSSIKDNWIFISIWLVLYIILRYVTRNTLNSGWFFQFISEWRRDHVGSFLGALANDLIYEAIYAAFSAVVIFIAIALVYQLTNFILMLFGIKRLGRWLKARQKTKT